jgi:integrase
MAQAWSLRRLGDVIDRYRAEVLPLKRAEQTRLEEGRALDKLKMAFGHMLPDNLTAVHCYGYIDKRRSKEGKPVPVAARHEIALLGHVYRKAKRWGAASINPASGLELPEKAGRRPYVPMEWVEAARGLASPRMRLAIDLAVMIGQRRGDLLKLKFSDVRADGVYVKQGKTGAELLIAMSPALEAILDESKAMAPQIPREYVLRRSNGQAIHRVRVCLELAAADAQTQGGRRRSLHLPRSAQRVGQRYGGRGGARSAGPCVGRDDQAALSERRHKGETAVMTQDEEDWLRKAVEDQKAIARSFAEHVNKVYWDAVLARRRAGCGIMEAHQQVMDALNSPQR